MPIPANQVTTVEWILSGLIASGGSNSVNTVNVFHFRRTATAVDPVKSAINTILTTNILTPLALALNLRWSAVHSTVRFVNDATDAPALFTQSAVGAVTGDGLSSLTAIFILQKTGLRGKTYRGGKHFGPLSEADVTATADDILNTAAVTRFAAIVTAMQAANTDSTGNIWVPTILSKKLSQLVVNPTTVVTNDVQSTLLNKRIGRMKKREVASVY